MRVFLTRQHSMNTRRHSFQPLVRELVNDAVCASKAFDYRATTSLKWACMIRSGLKEVERAPGTEGPRGPSQRTSQKIRLDNNFRRTHLRLPDRVIEHTRQASTRHAYGYNSQLPLTAFRSLSSCGVICTLIEHSSSFDRTTRILIRAYEVGVRLDSMAAYVS